MEKEPLKIMAVLDRFEGETAVLLLGPENKQALWPREFLPAGSKEGQIFTVTLAMDNLAVELARREVDELLGEIVAENEPGVQK